MLTQLLAWLASTVAGAWMLSALGRGGRWPSSVSGLEALPVALWWGGAALATMATVYFSARRWPPASLLVGAGLVLASLFIPVLGRAVSITVLAGLTGAIAAEIIPWRRKAGVVEGRTPSFGRAAALWGLVFSVHAFFSMYRHASFGSGSWDMGCMVHNFYRAAHGLDSASTVLGGVDYLGDHFMPGIYLYAPLIWISSSAYTVLAIQALNISAAAPAIYLMAKRRGLSTSLSSVLGLVAGLGFGLQSASYFDAHGITVGFGFFAFALVAIEYRRFALATVLLVLFMLFKESIGAYVVGLGLYLCLLGWRETDRAGARQTWRFGVSWIAIGAVGFVLVNRILMPALLGDGPRPEPHETYQDFGPTVFEAALGVLQNPGRAVAAVFWPLPKLDAHLVTFGGVGWLCLLAPELLLPALPLFAERFLSSKATMWEMGYHYAAPLTLFAAWGAVIGAQRLLARRPSVGAFQSRESLHGPSQGLAVYVVLSAALVLAFGYKHPANFLRLNQDYFLTGPVRARHARAIRWLEAHSDGRAVAAQDRLLPHLADRPGAYRLGEWEKADFVLLSAGQSAWPYGRGFPAQLRRTLSTKAGWVEAYKDASIRVFARVAPDAEGP